MIEAGFRKWVLIDARTHISTLEWLHSDKPWYWQLRAELCTPSYGGFVQAHLREEHSTDIRGMFVV